MQDDVTKASMVARAAVDADGTPLCHGERMTEVSPGVWMDPLADALLRYLQSHVPPLWPYMEDEA
jgi:hypothetical protein